MKAHSVFVFCRALQWGIPPKPVARRRRRLELLLDLHMGAELIHNHLNLHLAPSPLGLRTSSVRGGESSIRFCLLSPPAGAWQGGALIHDAD